MIVKYFNIENHIKQLFITKEVYLASYYNSQSFTSGTITDRVVQASHFALSPEQHALKLADYQRAMEGRIKRLRDRQYHFNRYLVGIDVEALKQALNSPSDDPSELELATYEEIQEIELYISLKYGTKKHVVIEQPEEVDEAPQKKSEVEIKLLQRLRSLDI